MPEPQSTSSASTADSGHRTIAIELGKSLDTKKLKPGDVVRAKITSVFSLDSGKAVPIGSTVEGHVTQAVTRSKGIQESSLGIAFDSIVLKDGQQIPLKATIQAVAAPPEWPVSNPANGNQGMGRPPIMGPGTPNPSGVPNPGGGMNIPGGYPQPQAPQGQRSLKTTRYDESAEVGPAINRRGRNEVFVFATEFSAYLER